MIALSMLQDSVDAAVLSQSVLTALPLAILRILAWILVGFAVVLACGLAGFIAGLALDRRHGTQTLR